jgi:hypothetical protein
MDLSTIIQELPAAVGAIALVALHAATLGYWSLRAINFHTSDWWAKSCTLWATGLALLGAETLALGHLGLLKPAAFFVSAAIMLGLFIYPAIKNGPRWFSEMRCELSAAFADRPLLAWTCGAMLLLVLYSALRPPFMTDELEYHWTAPLLWSQNARWVHSPFRGTNGPALGEIIYTISAVLGSPTAAHWTHSLFLMVLLLGCAALTRSIGASRGIGVAGVVAACLSCPVIINQASVSYNDLMAAAFAIAAYVPLFSSRSAKIENGVEIEARPCKSAIVVSALLFTAAVSVKYFLIVSIPIAILYTARPLIVRGGRMIQVHRRLLARVSLIAGPPLAVLAMWNLRAIYIMGGNFSGGHAIVHSETDPMWLNGAAAGRIPHLVDFLMLPLVPFITTIWGQHEPYGGRTGALILLFAPIGIFFAFQSPRLQRNRAVWLLTAGIVSFILLGPIAIKTRFHIFFWAVLCCFVGIGFNALGSAPSWRGKAATTVFALLMFVGMADIAHVLVPLKGAPNRIAPAAPPRLAGTVAGDAHE